MTRTRITTLPTGPDRLPLSSIDTTVRGFWETQHVLEDLDSVFLGLAVTRLLAAARTLGHARLQDMRSNCAGLLSEATGNPNITRFASGQQADHTHQHRNVLLSVLLTLSISERAQGALADPEVTSLPARPGGTGRALHDDEILLLRLWALQNATARRSQVACQYALTEAGAHPSETTVLTPGDFDDARDPSTVTLPGVTGRARPRTVALPAWSRPLVRLGLDQHLARHEHAHLNPFLYSGRHAAGGAAASATASSNLARAMKAVGLSEQRPEPLSIVRWRTAQTARQHGLRAAAALSGREIHNLTDINNWWTGATVQSGPRTFRAM